MQVKARCSNSKSQRGFTIIELLISIAVIGVLSGIGFGAFKFTQGRNNVNLAATTIATSLRRAQVASQAVDGDSQWGVRIINNNAIVFRGATYATRTTSFDESFGLPSNLTYTGLSEIVFTKVNGYPGSTGTITVTGSTNSSVLTLNAYGAISY